MVVLCNAYRKPIKMKKLLILTIFFSIISCKGQDTEENRIKAKDLVNEANNYFSNSKLEDEKKLDSCIVLVDKAINIDKTYFRAYYTKSKFLAWKKDIKESIKNNEKMIQLRPDQPMWKIQRGLFFDIEGNMIEAEKNYEIGINEYENLLKTELKNDFNFRIEYMSALETIGDIEKAKEELKNISEDFPDNEILKVYRTEYKFKTKNELIEIWKNGDAN